MQALLPSAPASSSGEQRRRFPRVVFSAAVGVAISVQPRSRSATSNDASSLFHDATPGSRPWMASCATSPLCDEHEGCPAGKNLARLPVVRCASLEFGELSAHFGRASSLEPCAIELLGASALFPPCRMTGLAGCPLAVYGVSKVVSIGRTYFRQLLSENPPVYGILSNAFVHYFGHFTRNISSAQLCVRRAQLVRLRCSHARLPESS